MLPLNQLLASLKATKQKMDSLIIEIKLGDNCTVEFNVADYWTVHVDVGDFWSLHQELLRLSANAPQYRLVETLGVSVDRMEQSGHLDRAQCLKIGAQLEKVIHWLETLAVPA